MPCGSKERQTISILCPFRVWYLCPVFASQILAFLSNDPVTILSLNYLSFILSEFYLPVRIVKGHRIHDIGVFIQREKFLSWISIPNFACPIIWACDELVTRLVECAVGKRKQMSPQYLEKSELLLLVLLLLLDEFFYELLQLGFAWLGYQGLFQQDLVN